MIDAKQIREWSEHECGTPAGTIGGCAYQVRPWHAERKEVTQQVEKDGVMIGDLVIALAEARTLANTLTDEGFRLSADLERERERAEAAQKRRDEAEVSELELAEHRSIRDLLITALVKATGASKGAVIVGPFSVAVKAAEARDALAAALAYTQKSCCLSGCYDCDQMAEVLDAHAPGWRDK